MISKKNKLYTVHAYRWGDRENHSYSVGVYSTKTKALKAKSVEEDWRGGKYTCEVIEWDVDQGIEGREFKPKVIVKLPNINTLKQRFTNDQHT